MSDEASEQVRGNKIAMIFQDPLTSLNPVYTVGDQIAEAILAHHDVSQGGGRTRAVELLDARRHPVPGAAASTQYPHELSGGMRQRVVIAIAMANDPDVIIADEPTTALDVTVQAQVLEALERPRDETGAAMVLITHDLGVDRRARRPRLRHVRRASWSSRAPSTRSSTPADAVHAGPARQPAPPRRGGRERLTPIAGAPPSLLEPAAGLPVRARAARWRDATLPAARSRALRRSTATGHVAACHFTDELAAPRRATCRGHVVTRRRRGRRSDAEVEDGRDHDDSTGGRRAATDAVLARHGTWSSTSRCGRGAIRAAGSVTVHAVCDVSFDI